MLKDRDTRSQADDGEEEAVLPGSKKGSTTERGEKSSNDREMDRTGKPWTEGEGTKGQGQIHAAFAMSSCDLCSLPLSHHPSLADVPHAASDVYLGRGERGF